MINLHVEPRMTYTWDEFRQHAPPYSIALDGIVKDSPKRDPSGPFANFDHHTGVDRLVTRSTCEQVYLELGDLLRVFRKKDIPTINIFINDCDEDTCLAVWLLFNHELAAPHSNPAVNRLVYCEDRLDATGGTYAIGDRSIARKMAWIFEPYHTARFQGKLATMDASGMRTIVESVCARITSHVVNGGEEIGLEGEFAVIGGGKKWAMVKETGPSARRALYGAASKPLSAFCRRKMERHLSTFYPRDPNGSTAWARPRPG